ncbi:MAG: hypothetical protein KDC84_08090 [Crocinitomicaceae bacterium]|nr:hypothetical protein [Crocinitomicaceae bacterium]
MKYIFQIFIGLGLIASGFFHQYSMQVFEIRIFELLGFDWHIIPIFGRIWSALEMYLGLTLILRINPKKIHTYLLALVALFVLYDTIWDLFINKNQLYIAIWPFYKIVGQHFVYYKIPLAVLLLIQVLMDLRLGKSTDLPWKWVKFVFPVGALAFTFIYNAILPRDLKYVESVHASPLNLEEINQQIKEGFDKVDPESDCLLMFVSLGCSHCLDATKKVAAIKRKHPNLNVRLMLFNDKKADVFKLYANAEELDHSVVVGNAFLEVTGGSVPHIMYLEKGEITHEWSGKSGSFNYDALSFVQSLK